MNVVCVCGMCSRSSIVQLDKTYLGAVVVGSCARSIACASLDGGAASTVDASVEE